MVEFERIYGDRVNLFGAILGRISRPNKLPLKQFAMSLNHMGGIVKSCGFAPGHAATFSSLPSSSSPFLNLAPALTNATR
jgi:hypothetical protein